MVVSSLKTHLLWLFSWTWGAQSQLKKNRQHGQRHMCYKIQIVLGCCLTGTLKTLFCHRRTEHNKASRPGYTTGIIQCVELAIWNGSVAKCPPADVRADCKAWQSERYQNGTVLTTHSFGCGEMTKIESSCSWEGLCNVKSANQD